MSQEINSQFDFFKAVQLDNEGNLLVSIVNLTGGTGDNYYTTGVTLSGTVLTFDRNDLPAAYTVNLSGITASGNLDGGTPNDILIFSNIDGGNP
jgi:hypothetical protein